MAYGTTINKEILKSWLEDLEKLSHECTSRSYLLSNGEVQKFIVGTTELLKAIVEKVDLFE